MSDTLGRIFMDEISRYNDGNGCSRRDLVTELLVAVSQWKFGSIREIVLEVLDDGCPCSGPHPQDKHPWELVEGHTNGDGDVVTEAIANEQRLKLVDEILRKVKEATI